MLSLKRHVNGNSEKKKVYVFASLISLISLRPSTVDRIAKELNAGVEKLLLKHVHYFLSDILLCSDAAKVKESFRLLISLLKFPLSSIFNFRKMDLVMLLVERLGEGVSASSVQHALRWVASFTKKVADGEGEGEGEGRMTWMRKGRSRKI